MKITKVLMGATAAIALGFAGVSIAASTPDGITAPVKPAAKDHPLDELWSGYKYAKPDTRAMQDDEFANPGMNWHDIGQEHWSKVEGEAGKACASCHGDDASSMKGVGARYPIVDEKSGKLVNIENRINMCRKENMKADPWKYDSSQSLGMTIFVKAQSRGMPVNVKVDGAAKPFFDKGKAFYYERRGQLDMACAQCHEGYFGQRVRMNTLSQGQSNGFPTYRLKWQKPGSLHRRFSGCNKQVRAKPFKKGSEEYLALELYLAWRGAGLPVETPAVRN
ncbi:MAG: sulfur oxidation c-type cytochrome SoxA [Methyloligellaceae bacterium]